MISSYKKLCTEFYDIDKPGPPAEEFNFYFKILKEIKQPVYEPMCGTGRFLIPLLKAGIITDGSDASAEMLEVCKAKIKKEKLSSVLNLCKLQELNLNRNYGAVFIPSGSFCLLTDKSDIEKSLSGISKVLIPGGLFVLEVLTKYNSALISAFENRRVITSDGSEILLSTFSEYNINKAIEVTECIYSKISDTKIINKESEVIELKYYSIEEFSDLLKAAGFNCIKAFKPFTSITANGDELSVVFTSKKVC